MLDQIILLAQILTVTGIAAWLSTGVWDNIVHPANNETYTAQVMGMTRMHEMYPDEYARVAHRAINNRTLQRLAFRFVVLAELCSTLMLWIGVGALIGALFGAVDPDIARALALLGAAMFTSIWAGFLVVGNYFCYWFCHEWGQNAHFQMALWGMGTMILLVAA